MRGSLGRTLRHNGNSTSLGTIDWGPILAQVAQAVPAVVNAVKPKTTTPAGGGGTTVYNQAPATKTDYTPWLIGGGLGLAALLAFTMNKRK